MVIVELVRPETAPEREYVIVVATALILIDTIACVVIVPVDAFIR